MTLDPDALLDSASVHPAVWERHPDYVALLMVVTNLEPGPPSVHSESLLGQVETEARVLLTDKDVQELAEVQHWREAYRAMGLKPRDARSSVESLLRRAAAGLPRIDRLTDIYNAMSVRHLTPIGGEDLRGYVGAPRLVVAIGDETFDTVANGEPVTHTATPGEVIWRDDIGVTCRRWNWRQCVRTRLTEQTTEALFIIDALGRKTRERAERTADDLVASLRVDSPSLVTVTHTLAPSPE